MVVAQKKKNESKRPNSPEIQPQTQDVSLKWYFKPVRKESTNTPYLTLEQNEIQEAVKMFKRPQKIIKTLENFFVVLEVIGLS